MTDITAYHDFLQSKQFKVVPAGFEPTQASARPDMRQ